MSDLFLIAHKVRTQPAFDVAIKLPCPECDTIIEADGQLEFSSQSDCPECNSEGHWWIIPTSGHRAYPWWSINLKNIDDTCQLNFEDTSFNIDASRGIRGSMEGPGPMPDPWHDHYTINNPSHKPIKSDRPQLDLLTRLNLIPKGPKMRRL